MKKTEVNNLLITGVLLLGAVTLLKIYETAEKYNKIGDDVQTSGLRKIL
jgi:hypothetical protein